MKRKLVTYIPIAVLAVGLGLGMAAALMALRPTSGVTPASANTTVADIAAGVPRAANTLVDLAPVTVAVSGASITPTPDKPGAAAKYEIKFESTSVLTNGLDTIVIRFDDDWNSQIPTTIDKTQVTISANLTTDSSGVGITGSANQAMVPQSVTVTREGPESDEPEITLTVPDMAVGDDAGSIGGNAISTGASVTIVFAQTAGIKNPTEARPNPAPHAQTDGHPATIWTSDDAVNKVTARVSIPAVVELNSVGDPRGTKLTAVAKGFEGTTTVTFWRDANANGLRDGAEIDLCSALAGSDDTATCTFDVNNPPFAAGRAVTATGCTATAIVFPAAPTGVSGCNYVNAVDGESRTATVRTQDDITRQNFLLEGFISFSPATADPGDTVTVQLKDFVAGVLEFVRLGSKFICGAVAPAAPTPPVVACTQTVPSSSELNFEIIVPDGVPTGRATMFVKVIGAGNRTEDDDLVIGGAALTITPSTAVPNQRVSVNGSGFSEGGSALINGSIAEELATPCTQASRVTIGGETVHRSKINDDKKIVIDNGGTWSASIDLPITSATTTEGPREFKFIDCKGREGKANLVFPDQIITIDPAEGRVGSDVRVKGTGFAAKNNDGNSTNVLVTYTAGTDTNQATVTPDSGGTWETIIQVPSDAAIPSTNTVRAEFNLFDPLTDLQSTTKSITTVTHRVPAAAITLDKTSGPPGTTVTLTAVGFKRFTPVLTLKVGTIEVTPSPKPSTDALGNATIQFVVPGADTGIQTVELKVDVTTGSMGFTVTSIAAPPGGPAPTTPIAIGTALATPLGVDFVRAFNFNNQTKVWTFNDPRPEFTAINTLTQVTGGLVYWVNVANDKTITFCGRSVTFYKGWNQAPC